MTLIVIVTMSPVSYTHLDVYKRQVQDAIEIREELVKQGYLRAQKSRIRKKKKQELPHYETFLFDDYRIYVGKNNLQNDYVTWKLARKKDTWLHAKDLHGAHAVSYTHLDVYKRQIRIS